VARKKSKTVNLVKHNAQPQGVLVKRGSAYVFSVMVAGITVYYFGDDLVNALVSFTGWIIDQF